MNSPRKAAAVPPGTAATAQARQTSSSKGVFGGKRTTAPSSFWSRRKKIAALSAIFGIIIGLGVTAAAGGTLYFTFQSQTDPFTASSAVELRNLNVVRDDDRLTVTGVLKNSGQTSISRLWIDNLAVSNIVAFQSRNDGSDPTSSSDDLVLYVRQLDSTDHFICLSISAPSCVDAGGVAIDQTNNHTSYHAATLSTRDISGISMLRAGDNVESVLEGGRTQAFKVVIACDGPENPDVPNECDVIDISRNVAISDRLTLTFGYASGDDILVSDAYSARVRSG